MPTLRHPRARDDVPGDPPRTIPSDAVGERVTVDDAGEFTIDDAADARSLADAYGVTVADLVIADTETCDAIKSDGDVCGRELPCRYHDAAAPVGGDS